MLYNNDQISNVNQIPRYTRKLCMTCCDALIDVPLKCVRLRQRTFTLISSGSILMTTIYLRYTSKGIRRQGVSSFCKKSLGVNTMPCRHMPLLVHS